MWFAERLSGLQHGQHLLLALVLLGCLHRAPSPQAIRVILFWPVADTATIWLSVRDAQGTPLAVAGAATIKLWTRPEIDTPAPLGEPLYTMTADVSAQAFAANECRPCALAGSSKVAPLGSISFTWLQRDKTHRGGLIEVTLASGGRVFTDSVRFSLPQE